MVVEWALLAWSFAIRSDPIARAFAFGAGAFAYLLLLGFIADLRYPAYLHVTANGIRCRWAAPEVDLRWDEIQRIETKNRSSKLGWVRFTFTDAALARFPDRRARRIRRSAKLIGAHYRWADLFSWSSAEETATLLEILRTSPEARASLVHAPTIKDVSAPAHPGLPAMPAPPAA